MKFIILAILVLILSSFSIAVASEYEFSTRLIPEKIIVGSEGILQIHTLKNGNFFPKQIENIAIVSTDPSIVQILETKNSDSLVNVKIKAIKEGNAEISIAGQGFASQKFPIAVFGSKNNQAQLLLKVTPNTFNINGPRHGYASVTLTDSDGNPTRAIDDIKVDLTTSRNGIINLDDQQLVIPKGEYFTIKEFTILKAGDVTVYASSDNMDTVSDVITVNQGSTPPLIQLYVYPKTISSYATSYSYAIVQLQDSAGNPIKATEDIPISVRIVDSALGTSVNSSPIYEQIQTSGPLVIPKDSYWGYVKLITRHGLEGVYDVSISAQNYEVSSSVQLTSVDLELLDDKYPKMESLPILATGNEELIGVLHLEDTSANPVGAERDFVVQIDSSDNNALQVKNTLIKRGFSSELVFAKVGLLQPDSLTLKFPSEIDEIITPTISGPTKSSLSLSVEPLISKAITDTEFPIFAFLSNVDEFTYFLEDTELRIEPNEYFKIENQKIQKGQGGVLLNAKATKDGSTALTFETNEHSAVFDMESIVSKPTSIYLSGPQTVFAGLENVFVVQIMDSQDEPLYSAKDMDIQLVTNDKSILDIPEKITIPRGQYFAIFSAEAQKAGITDIVALADSIPISEYNVNVKELLPTVTINSPDNVSADAAVTVSLLAQYHDVAIPGMDVQWSVTGAQIIDSEQTTNENGIATATIISDSTSTFTIDATASGSGFGSSTASKAIGIMDEIAQKDSTNLKPLSINGFDPLPIVIPGAIASGALLLKKKTIIAKIKPEQS